MNILNLPQDLFLKIIGHLNRGLTIKDSITIPKINEIKRIEKISNIVKTHKEWNLLLQKNIYFIIFYENFKNHKKKVAEKKALKRLVHYLCINEPGFEYVVERYNTTSFYNLYSSLHFGRYKDCDIIWIEILIDSEWHFIKNKDYMVQSIINRFKTCYVDRWGHMGWRFGVY